MHAIRMTTTPPGQSRRPQRSPVAFLLASLALSTLLVLLSACGTGSTGKSSEAAPVAHALSVQQVRVHLAPAPLISTTMRSAQRHLYTFSRANVGLMQPAVDAQGNIWVGEMNANRLGRLNTQTAVVTSWTPPGAQYGIMTTVVDAQGDAWFAEQNANYIGRFDPRQQTFRIFPLGTWQGSPLGPQDLHFDSKGLLWFAAPEGGAIGQLDPWTGAVRLWPGLASPSTLTVTPTGQVWFGADGAVGILDPPTDQITLYLLPNPQTQVFSMARDATGRLWFTEVVPGKLGLFDPATATLTELPLPAVAGTSPALYELVIDHTGQIWFVDAGARMLDRYTPGQHALTFFRLSVPGSAPFGLTLDPAGNLWFTAGGSPANYVGEVTP